MKKFTTLVLAAGLVVSSFAGASAAEFKPNAQFINQFEGGTAGSAFAAPRDGRFGSEENFKASLRLRLGFDYIASEDLSGTFLMQIGDSDYGQNSVDAVTGHSSSEFDNYITNFKVRLAYVDWVVPTSVVQVRMGFQPMAMPSFAFGSAVLDARGSGVTIAAPINDNVSLGFVWARAKSNDTANFENGDDADILAITADFNYDGFRVAPWAMYAMAGNNTNGFGNLGYPNPTSSVDAYYIGASFELSMFDPFKFALDAYYSGASFETAGISTTTPATLITRDDDMDGFFVGFNASYKTDYGIPALKGWYASGNDVADGDDLGLGQPAVIVGFFNATSIMFGGQVMDNGMSNYNTSPAGTMGVVLEWADLSFIQKLNHTTRIAYIMGTNDFGDVAGNSKGDITNLGTEDSVIEFNFNSTYEIYKNLSTTLELGYLTADFDKVFTVDEDGADDAIMRAALSFTYSF